MIDRQFFALFVATTLLLGAFEADAEIHGPRRMVDVSAVVPPEPVSAEPVEVFDFPTALEQRITSTDSNSAIQQVSRIETPLPGIDDQVALVDATLPVDAKSDGDAEDETDADGESAASEPGLFLPPPVSLCEEPQGMPLSGASDSLFAPLSTVRLDGMSTTPPESSDGEDHLLERPENDACAYLGMSYPACYATAPQLAAFGPYRNAFPFCHRPLYFEDPNLERCGRGWGCLTTVRSAGLFAGQLATLPIHMLIDCPRKRVRALPDCPTCHKFGVDAYSPACRICR